SWWAPVTKELRSEPPEGGRKRKGTGGTDRICAAPTRAARESGRGLSTPSAFSSPPPAKCERGKASTTSTLHPVTSSSASRVESNTTATRSDARSSLVLAMSEQGRLCWWKQRRLP
ncbi:hypothetical protein AMTR_s00001p00272750, partial [Amborella trichopoda]